MKSLFLILILATPCIASKTGPVGFFARVMGRVLVIDTNQKKEENARDGTKIYSHSSIQTLSGARAKLVFKDGTIINIAQNTFFEIESFLEDESGKKNSSIKLFYGKLRSIVNHSEKNNFKIKTPAAVMGVRGTDFYATFSRNFKNRSSTSSVYTVSGLVSLRRKIDDPERIVLVHPGSYSTITVKSDGTIEPPTAPHEISPEKLHQHIKDMLPLALKEPGASFPVSSYISILDKNFSSSKAKEPVKTETGSPQKFQFQFQEDTGISEIPVESPDIEEETIHAPKPEPGNVQGPVEKRSIAPELNPEKVPAVINQSPGKTSPPLPASETLASALKQEVPTPSPVKDRKTRESLFKTRFELKTWAAFNEWMIIHDILKKKGDKSLVRFLRHPLITEKNKKRTKISTLDAIFYDKKTVTGKIMPCNSVTKLSTSIFTDQRRFKGSEIEFLVTPGTYLVSIDNGPVSEIKIGPMKDITIKTGAFLSPGSEYSIFNPLTKTLIPFRDRGNPISVLPGKYRILKETRINGIFTGKRKHKIKNIAPDSVTTPAF